jgi:hypothetical protein
LSACCALFFAVTVYFANLWASKAKRDPRELAVERALETTFDDREVLKDVSERNDELLEDTE